MINILSALMSITSKHLLSLMCRHLLALSFLSTRHEVALLLYKVFILLQNQALRSIEKPAFAAKFPIKSAIFCKSISIAL